MDPTFAGAGAAVIAQGVTFLYSQAGEILRLRREKRQQLGDADTHTRSK